MRRPVRLLIGLVLVAGVALCALSAGSYIAGHCCVAEGSGLAGGAIVLGYGVAAAAIAAPAALLAAVYLPPRWLVGVTLPFAIAGAILLALIWRGLVESQERTAAHLQQSYDRLGPFEVALRFSPSATGRPFTRAQMDWGQRALTIETRESRCTGPIDGATAVQMLSALREAEVVIYQDPNPCAGDEGVIEQQMDYRITEATLPDSVASLSLSRACLARNPALEAPFRAMQAIAGQVSSAMTCSTR